MLNKLRFIINNYEEALRMLCFQGFFVFYEVFEYPILYYIILSYTPRLCTNCRRIPKVSQAKIGEEQTKPLIKKEDYP